MKELTLTRDSTTGKNATIEFATVYHIEFPIVPVNSKQKA